MQKIKRGIGRPSENDENYTKLMSFAVTEEMRKKIKNIAKNKEITMSKLMRNFLDRILEEETKDEL